jgi:hypothetical protein
MVEGAARRGPIHQPTRTPRPKPCRFDCVSVACEKSGSIYEVIPNSKQWICPPHRQHRRPFLIRRLPRLAERDQTATEWVWTQPGGDLSHGRRHCKKRQRSLPQAVPGYHTRPMLQLSRGNAGEAATFLWQCWTVST